MKLIIKIVMSGFLCVAAFTSTAEPTLTINTKSEKKVFSLSNLAKRNDLETVTVKQDPAYSYREMKYKAVPLTHLFTGLKIEETSAIYFKSLDGFSAALSSQKLLNQSPKGSIAYIALELPTEKWPPIKPGKPSAGPFYLIWKNPEYSHIVTEEWPFAVVAFDVKGTLQSTYPKIFPRKSLSKNDPAVRGAQVFVKNCFVCHTINLSGDSHVGPDLNVPMNPTEYFRDGILQKLIRNPQNLRHWPEGRMQGFSVRDISDAELYDVIAYLKQMARERADGTIKNKAEAAHRATSMRR